MRYYILDENHQAIPCEDMNQWTKAFEDASRRVALDFVGKYRISTVFLGLDHNHRGGPPLLFETMVFIGDSFHDEIEERCCTWDEAVKQHKRIVKQMRETEE